MINPKNILANKPVEHEVDDEIRFHLEQLAESYLDQELSPEGARARALEQFGNVEQVRQQCIRIARRQGIFQRVIKAMLLGMFVAGVGVRVSSSDPYVGQLGNMLIVIALSGRLWIYLRTLRPARRPHVE